MPKFTEAIQLATREMLNEFDDLAIFGLGVSYPNGADGTMGSLGQDFPDRVLDTPASESTVTGLAIGAAISGKKTIVHHGRVEFALFASDQIVTQAANWNYMYGGKSPVPVTFRVALGRQWGNGPQHTGGHIPLFSGTPGLKVVCPSSPKSAYELLKWAVSENNPVVYLEPRWLYQVEQEFEASETLTKDPSPELVRLGDSLTLVSYGEGVLEAVLAAQALNQQGVSAEVIDLKLLTSTDYSAVIQSVRKTGKLIVIDPYSRTVGVGADVVSVLARTELDSLSSPPILLTPPFVPVPTALSLTESFYAPVSAQNIIDESVNLLALELAGLPNRTVANHLPPKLKLGLNWEIL